MRLLIATAIVLGSVSFAGADDKQFFLSADGNSVIEKRVSDLEKRVADLEKKLAAKATAERGPVNPLSPVAPTAAPVRITFQTCRNGICSTHECDDMSKVPFGATNVTVWSGATSAASGSPCPTGPCGANCQCGTMMAMPSTSSVSSGGDRWFLGKNLGRGRLRAGGCASCGQ